MPTPPTGNLDRRVPRAGSIAWVLCLCAALTPSAVGAGLWQTHSLSADCSEALKEHRDWNASDRGASDLERLLAAALSQVAARIENDLAHGAADVGDRAAHEMKMHFSNYRAQLASRGLVANG